MTTTLPPPAHALGEDPCPRCLPVAFKGRMWLETLGRLALDPAVRPTAHDGSGECCFDCQAADTLMRAPGLPTWEMARVAVSNDRAEQLRAPGLPMGLVLTGHMRPSQKGDFEEQHAWLIRARLVQPDQTPADSELRYLRSERRKALTASVAPCFNCGKSCDREENFCHGCGEVTCGDCEVNHLLMGPHDVSDHYAEPDEEGGW